LHNIAATVDSLRQCDLWLLHRMDRLGHAVAGEVAQWRAAEAVHGRAEARIQALATETEELKARLAALESQIAETDRRSGNALTDARTAIVEVGEVRRLRDAVRGHAQQLEVLARAPSSQVRMDDHAMLESLRMSLALQFEQVALHLRGQWPGADIASRIQAAQRDARHRSRTPSLAGEARPGDPASAASSRPPSDVGCSPR
jgi:hypothetical protein